MKPINHNRKLGEISNHLKVYTRDTKQRFHLENLNWLSTLIKLFLKGTFLAEIGAQNALKIRKKEIEFTLDRLPSDFDGYRVLFISDLHSDAMVKYPEIMKNLLPELQYDICILGGDYKFRAKGNPVYTFSQLGKILPVLTSRSQVYAILGNHDLYEIAEFMDQQGVVMLLNDNIEIQKNSSSIYIVGVDDGHYFNALDFEEAEKGLPHNVCKILISHSPEFYREAEGRDYDLYLSGHTHAGQICLPGRIPVLYNAPVKRTMIYGSWKFNNLTGYTSCGFGTSMVPVRLFCPPEVVLITLRSQSENTNS
jgi:predicted MPP superfamily phosphohydrolase